MTYLGGRSMDASPIQILYQALMRLCFYNKSCPITFVLYNAIIQEIIRLRSQRNSASIAKAQKTQEACSYAASRCTIFVNNLSSPNWNDNNFKASIDKTLATYLLAYTRPALKITRDRFFSASVSQSWKNVKKVAAAQKLTNKDIDKFLDEFLVLDKGSINVKRRAGSSISCVSKSYCELASNTFEDFKQKTKAKYRNDYNFDLTVQSPLIDTNGNITYGETNTGTPLTFNVVGCQGVSGLNMLQRVTWRNMQQLIAHHMNKSSAQFNVLLGDNIYSHGALSPNDYQSFKVNFHDVYNKFSFLLLGNHDYGIGGGVPGRKGNLAPWNKAAVQIVHTSPNNNWYLPNRYYVVVSEHAVFYYIDSSTYIFDQDQQNWLQEVTRSLQASYLDRWHILCSHHPLESYGKRGFGMKTNEAGDQLLRETEATCGGKPMPANQVRSSDTDRYRDKLVSQQTVADEEPQTVAEHGCGLGVDCSQCGQSMSVALRNKLADQCISFDVVFAAHDHYFSAGTLVDPRFKNTFQAIIGCGGKRNQTVKFTNIITKDPQSFRIDGRYAAEEFGFLSVVIEKDKIQFDGINHQGQSFYKHGLDLQSLRSGLFSGKNLDVIDNSPGPLSINNSDKQNFA